MTKNIPHGKKVGLALGSGVARGLAHIGVLQVLEREDIPVDMIAGTSIGAVVGALYALGKPVSEILEIAREVGSHKYNYLVDLNIPRTGLIRGKKIEDQLKKFYGDAEFSDLVLPFKCVATDIDNGQAVIIDEGPLWKAVRASISLPVILAVARWKDKHLVDGALVDPVPVDILRQMGAEIVIAVNVIPDRNIRDKREPNIFDVIMQTLYIVGFYAVKESVTKADVILEPEVNSFALTDFHRVDECVEKGTLSAVKAIPHIKEILADSNI
jgi:NTE family protein